MSIRKCCMLAAAMAVLGLCGCQRAETKIEAQVPSASSDTATQPEKPKSPQPRSSQIEYTVSWEEKCTVEQAFGATNKLLYETLNLQRIPYQGGGGYQQPVKDYVSAVLKARSSINVVFEVNIFLESSGLNTIALKAISATQPKEILEKHSLFIKQKISEAIKRGPAQDELSPYPITTVLECDIVRISLALSEWAQKMAFNCQGSSGDAFYKQLFLKTGSGISFTFVMRRVEANKVKLEMDVQSYEDKEEFKMILNSLDEVLKGLQEEKAEKKDSL